MLVLMRDPQVDLDQRIDIAAKAAPFVHPRPAPVRKSDDLKFAKLEAKPDTTKPAANGGGSEGAGVGCAKGEGADGSDREGLSPLDFLLEVMADPAVDSDQRVKAAAVAARYKHAVAAPDLEAPSKVVADKFGFTVAPELARAERDDRLREAALRTTLHVQKHLRKNDSYEAKRAEQELEEIRKRRAERLALVKFPDGYAYADRQKDESRLAQLSSKRASRKKLPPQEDAEEAHLAVRVLHPQAKPPSVVPTPSADEQKPKSPMTRMIELEERRAGGETLTAAEDEELKGLRSGHPEIAADVDRLDNKYNYCLRQELEKQGIQKLRAVWEKCAPLRDPRKMLNLKELREGPHTRMCRLESLRFDALLTSEEADELEDLHRRYPERAAKARKFVVGRLIDGQINNEAMVRTGSKPRPVEQGYWPRIWTTAADNVRMTAQWKSANSAPS